MRYCRKAAQVIDKLLSSLGLTRHPTERNGSGVPGWNILVIGTDREYPGGTY
jgi:hypothetical protein